MLPTRHPFWIWLKRWKRLIFYSIVQGMISSGFKNVVKHNLILIYYLYSTFENIYFRYVPQGNIFECNEAEWDRTFDINVKSMYQMCHAFLPKVSFT